MNEILKAKAEEYAKEVAFYHEEILRASAKLELINELMHEQNFIGAEAADGADTQTENGESAEMPVSVAY